MYVGRIVAIGRNQADQVCAMYRVSSRSFPNRTAKQLNDSVAILPRSGFEDDIQKSPYIAYNCMRIVDQYAVVSNGSHTDILAGKLEDGNTVRDTLVSVLHSMDYEHDALETPRIAGIVDCENSAGYLGIITKSSLFVKRLELPAGSVMYVATYEHTEPGLKFSDSNFDVRSAEAACSFVIGEGVFADLEKPVTAACAVYDGGAYRIACQDAEQ